MKFKKWIIINMALWMIVSMQASTYGLFGFGKKDKPEPDVVSTKSVTVAPKKDTRPLLEEEVLYQLQQEYEKAVKAKQFDEMLTVIYKIPESQRTKEQVRNEERLLIFDQVIKDLEAESADFFKEDDLDDDTRRAVKRLYAEAQLALLRDEDELARDLLIQVLYLHRRNYKAKKLLEYALDLRPGGYSVENVEKKYWDKSSVLFYGGNYDQAVDSLKVLTYINKDNSLVYERMGSSYYMLGLKKEAIGSWNTASFLDPDNKELPKIIEKTEKLMAKEAEEEQAKLQAKKAEKKQKKADVEYQKMGVFPTETKAYNYAAQMRNQGLDPLVEENDEGKWEVLIPKKKE